MSTISNLRRILGSCKTIAVVGLSPQWHRPSFFAAKYMHRRARLPIYQTTSFVFDSADHAASLFNLQTFGNVYSRLSNPTVAALEERVAALEGGRAAVASASGMAAEAMALMTILQAGDHVVAAGALYGGSVTMLAVNLKKFGIETSFVDATDPDAFAAAMRPNTRAVFAETLGNPSLVVLDIAAVAAVAHAHGVPLVVDNTVPSPFLCNPLRWAPTSWCTAPPSTWPATAPRWAAWWWKAAASPGTTASSPGMTEPSRLPRREVLRDLRRLRLHHALPHGNAARLRRGAVAHQCLADPAGRGDAAAAHGAPLQQTRWQVAQFLQAAPGGGLGQLPGPPDMVRLSVGIEDAEDIIWDIDQALRQAVRA
jgi:hypothetical protein